MRRAVVITSLLAAASAAQAQIEVPPMDMAGAMLNREAMRVQLGAVAGAPDQRRPAGATPSGRGGGFAPQRAPAVRAVRTSFRADAAVTARVRGQFLDFMRRTSGPAGADALRQAFARNEPLQFWAKSVAADGMRLGDVGDAMTEYWVQNWMMANDVRETPPSKVRAVRAQVQRVLSQSPAIARLNDAQRQEMAEIYIYNMMVQGEVYGSAVKSGDRATQTRIGNAAQARMQNEMHLDPRRLALTEAGFVQRG